MTGEEAKENCAKVIFHETQKCFFFLSAPALVIFGSGACTQELFSVSLIARSRCQSQGLQSKHGYPQIKHVFTTLPTFAQAWEKGRYKERNKSI